LRPAAEGNVTRLEHNGREIFIVGTAHVSKKSAEEVRRVIGELRPDSVCVELDSARCEALSDETRWGRIDAREILRTDRAGLFLASLLFSAFQKRLGDRLGVRPGAEMLAAIEAAREVGAEIVLADRSIQATLMRCYRSLGVVDRAQIVLVLGMLPFAAADIDEAQVEKLKSKEMMGDVMETFAREMPRLQVPLIDERDRYLMASVEAASGHRVVAVVGAAHVPGMTRHLGEGADLAALSVIPPPAASSRALAWLSPLLLAGLVTFAVSRGLPVNSIAGLIGRYAGPSACGAVLLAAASGGGLATMVLTLIVAPVTLAVPGVPLGKLSGLAQTWSRPPLPEHGMALRSDVLSPAKARKNPFVRALLVAVATPFGRSSGAAVGFVWAGWALVKALHR